MSKIDINNRYPEHQEVRGNNKPYEQFAECVFSTFEKFTSFCDIGCATGHLIYFINKKENTKVKGYEYFEYHKTSKFCQDSIRPFIEIYDIRDELPLDVEKFDIVNCSEVGEHIDPQYADVLIENAKKLSKRFIIFTWSSHGGLNEPDQDPNHQHLNPLSKEDYINLMRSHNLKPNWELTEKFLNFSKKCNDFYFWWRESLIVWEMV